MNLGKTDGYKIGIHGSFSTGKTTLVKNISMEGLSKVISSERIILKETGKHLDNMTLEELENFQIRLIEYQIQEEKKHKSFITDQTQLTCLAYSIGNPFEKKIRSIVENNIKNQLRYNIEFHLPIEIPLQGDEVRPTLPGWREEVNERLEDLYREYSLQPIILSGSIEERMKVIQSFLR